jgi:hypothetical protein
MEYSCIVGLGCKVNRGFMCHEQVLDSLGITERIAKENDNAQENDEVVQEEVKAAGGKRPPSDGDPVHISLKYVILPKVTSVRIQPTRNLFAQVGPVKLVLEENLRHHSTLSMGDRLTVYYRGVEHTLIVKALTLDSDIEGGAMDEDNGDTNFNKTETECRGGTLINTDVVVDIDVSEEYLQSQEHDQKEQHGVGQTLLGNTLQGQVGTDSTFPSGSGGRKLGEVESAPAPPPAQMTPTVATSTAISSTGKAVYDMSLDDEPAVGESGVITCKVKTPQGKTFTRRFDRTKPLRQLFAFVRLVLQTHQLPSPQEDEALQLSTRQPVRKFSEVEVCTSSLPLPTFLSAGIESKNEMFFVAFV